LTFSNEEEGQRVLQEEEEEEEEDVKMRNKGMNTT